MKEKSYVTHLAEPSDNLGVTIPACCTNLEASKDCCLMQIEGDLARLEYEKRAEKAIAEQDPKILQGVVGFRKHNGYCELGDYASYEYLQWQKENESSGDKDVTDLVEFWNPVAFIETWQTPVLNVGLSFILNSQ